MNISISVQTDGADIAAFAEQIQENISSALLNAAEVVAENARAICPVDTGTLRASIGTSVSGNTAQVYAGADYAVYVEMGTYKMAAQPFLTPALAAAENAVISAINV